MSSPFGHHISCNTIVKHSKILEPSLFTVPESSYYGREITGRGILAESLFSRDDLDLPL